MTIKNQELITKIEQEYINNNVPQIKVGDTIRLGIKIQEGQKIRTQYYEGVIKNSGLNKTITVRRIMQGIGIERCFLINSPKIESITIQRSSKIRRSKLYYLRQLEGKATRLKQKFD
jgi:large subunit ribosomal protein L19